MKQIKSAIRLLKLAVSDPKQLARRLAIISQARLEPRPNGSPYYSPIPVGSAVEQLSKVYGASFASYTEEKPLLMLEKEVALRLDDHQGHIKRVFDADPVLARMCYAICRACKPRIVIETGVARGVTSAYLLAALEQNDHGFLHSVDLPPLNASSKNDVGIAVPERLRKRWKLHYGASRDVLPKLAAENAPISMFIHDSLHTYATILWELDTVSTYLAPDAVVMADDIQGNLAFQEWVESRTMKESFVVRSDRKAKAIFGIGIPQAIESA